ncbi:ABC transporter ATP-binding protein [Mediterraneibacter massiliensis]|jgi:ABC-2 type transport system ATP-binding protein|uniref:ABC transporter ATP-binding protein n=1 Tax=Mediterraneibacter massiliensis TaxID=1720300 RepID=UPI000E4D77BB|nr:ATP-binding cassette domain-containing protein [Mediterraneibacter massiliensis]RGT72301.1 ATP-binding cassette domain-containing protein [Ruminococcus sp. AF18-22]
MIEIENLTKYFGALCAVNHISFTIPNGSFFGLLGTNGAGKSTLLKILSGILTADEGTVKIDAKQSCSSPAFKQNFFYLPDDPYYFPNASLETMIQFYKQQYPSLDTDAVSYMADSLNLDIQLPLRTFSKGMKRQAFLLLALNAGTKYLFCDEVFDGLDPLVTELMKNLFLQEMKCRDFTVIVASHKLDDLQDICQNISILHKGGLVTSADLTQNLTDIHKIQCVFSDASAVEELQKEPPVIRCQTDGYFTTLLVRGESSAIHRLIREKDPVFSANVALTLEELFMIQMEENGYDIRKTLL